MHPHRVRFGNDLYSGRTPEACTTTILNPEQPQHHQEATGLLPDTCMAVDIRAAEADMGLDRKVNEQTGESS